jgi:DNA invertase Pin-like site-specific DNA recombinase
MTIGYIRVSTDKQTNENQKSEIRTYCNDKLKITVDDWIEPVAISSRKDLKDRKIDDLLSKASKNDKVIVSELSRLGRSTQEVLQIIEKLMKLEVEVHIIKSGQIINPNNKNDFTSKAMVTLLGLFAELERDLISLRTKEALKSKKEQGVRLGKPEGTIQKSKYDEHKNRIVELKNLGLSLNKIVSNHLEPVMGKGNCSVQSLSTYITKREL